MITSEALPGEVKLCFLIKSDSSCHLMAELKSVRLLQSEGLKKTVESHFPVDPENSRNIMRKCSHVGDAHGKWVRACRLKMVCVRQGGPHCLVFGGRGDQRFSDKLSKV